MPQFEAFASLAALCRELEHDEGNYNQSGDWTRHAVDENYNDENHDIVHDEACLRCRMDRIIESSVAGATGGEDDCLPPDPKHLAARGVKKVRGSKLCP